MLRCALPLLLGLSAALWCPAAQATASISAGVAPGAPSVPNSETPFIPSWGEAGNGNIPFVGQTFKTPDTTNVFITAFAVYIRAATHDEDDEIDYEVFLKEYDTATNTVVGPKLFGDDYFFSKFGPVNGEYLPLVTTMRQPVQLNASKTYLFFLQALTMADSYSFPVASSPTYSGGDFCTNTQSTGVWACATTDTAFWATFQDTVQPPTLSPTSAPTQAPTRAPTLAPTLACDATGITLSGRTNTRAVTVIRPTTGRALAFGSSTAGRGRTLRYTVTLANKNAKSAAAFAPAGLVVTLPAGTTYANKARVSPPPTMPGAATHKAHKNATLVTPVYDAQAHTLTWPDVPLAAGRKRMYTVYAKVAPTATTPLVFQAACPNCPQLATQSSVTVTAKTK